MEPFLKTVKSSKAMSAPQSSLESFIAKPKLTKLKVTRLKMTRQTSFHRINLSQSIWMFIRRNFCALERKIFSSMATLTRKRLVRLKCHWSSAKVERLQVAKANLRSHSSSGKSICSLCAMRSISILESMVKKQSKQRHI